MNNLSKDKKPYEAPQLTVVTFKTERGYASSGLRSLWIGAWVSGSGDPNATKGLNDYTVNEELNW